MGQLVCRYVAVSGKQHNYIRMYWAKKILEWSAGPAEGWRIAIHLNNKFSLVGLSRHSLPGVSDWFTVRLHGPYWLSSSEPCFENCNKINVVKSGGVQPYSLDGRDPASYTGVGWCWPARPRVPRGGGGQGRANCFLSSVFPFFFSSLPLLVSCCVQIISPCCVQIIFAFSTLRFR
jgi:hypothetical protein